MERGGVDWVHLDQDENPVAGFCKHGIELSGYRKYWKILE
jgi:hypothetical protein